MRKLIVIMLVMLIFYACGTCANAESTDACINEILTYWNATTPNELRESICQFWVDNETDDNPEMWKPKYHPCNIRIGGTTQELIKDGKRWDMAIVSSKDVDLQVLADKDCLATIGFNPDYRLALHQWLVPEHLQAMLPEHPLLLYFVYFYDYDEAADEATLLICRDRKGEVFAEEILCHRPVEKSRHVEGIQRMHYSGIGRPLTWNRHTLLADPSGWDVATFDISSVDEPVPLMEAGLLFDFSAIDYFAARDGLNVIHDWERDSPNGVFLQEKMVGIPCYPIRLEFGDVEQVLVVNAKSPNLEGCLHYAEHYIKSIEWSCEMEHEEIFPHGVCMYKDQCDW